MLQDALNGFKAGGGILIIGEQHDNAEHHRLQGALVRSLAGDAKAVVFEQFRANEQAKLDELSAQAPAPPVAQFKSAMGWEKSGWAQYNYDALLSAVLDANLALYAGDATRETIKKVAKEGAGALPAEARARLKLDAALGTMLDDASLKEIEDSHCNMMPKASLKAMAFAQRYRDAQLADVVLKAVEAHGSAILIAGNGHARTDRGVPWYIRQAAPDMKVVSVMLVEVENAGADPEAYVPRDPDGKPAADFVILTPAAKRDDPCAVMKRKAP